MRDAACLADGMVRALAVNSTAGAYFYRKINNGL